MFICWQLDFNATFSFPFFSADRVEVDESLFQEMEDLDLDVEED